MADYEGKKIDVGPIFECQLKATINWQEEADFIVYDMDAAAFNKLVFQNNESSVPTYLVLLCLPRDQVDWVSISPDSLQLRKCCFYELIDGARTENTSSVRVRIPKSNIFSPDSVDEIIQEASQL